MIAAEETFDGTFPFAPHFCDAAGFRMHYVDEGEGDPIVCLHGEPTWGYLYRKFIPPLARTHRVIVPDHMGFGKSETPQDREYTLRTHVENLVALIDALDLKKFTFVLQDWGGPIGIGYAVRHASKVRRICLMNTLSGYGLAMRDKSEARLPAQNSSPWFQWVAKGVEDGSYFEVMGNMGSTVLSIMNLISVGDLSGVDQAWVRAFSAPFPDREACKGAIEFPLDVVQGRITDFVGEGTSGVAALREIPAMLAEGMQDRGILPELAIADFKTLWPKGPVVQLPNAGHFCQEDCPETLVALIQQFIQMTDAADSDGDYDDSVWRR